MEAADLTTLGCIMARVVENDSGEIIEAQERDLNLTFCHTTDSESNTIIVTPEMRELGEAGIMPIAITRVDLTDPSQFWLFGLRGLSQGLRLALEHQGCDLVCIALSYLTEGKHMSAVSH